MPEELGCLGLSHNKLQGALPTTIGFVTLGHLLFIGDHGKKWSRVTKPGVIVLMVAWLKHLRVFWNVFLVNNLLSGCCFFLA